MTTNLTCAQVSALLSFYIDDKLSCQLKQFVSAHLEACPMCKSKFETLKCAVTSLRSAQEKLSSTNSVEENKAENAHYDEFLLNLSAYVDNELSDTENIKVKKYVISNPKARQELEKMYCLKKALNNSFEKTKNDSKDDYSKFILNRIDMQEEIYGNDYYPKIVAIFILVFAIFTATAIAIFWV